MSFLSSIHISQHLQQWRAPAVQQRWTENERKVPSVKESKLGINLLLKHREKERKGSGILSEFELKKKLNKTRLNSVAWSKSHKQLCWGGWSQNFSKVYACNALIFGAGKNVWSLAQIQIPFSWQGGSDLDDSQQSPEVGADVVFACIMSQEKWR